MNRKHICFIGNYPSHYRKSIFKMMDRTFDMEWHFMEQDTTIKMLDIRILKNAIIEKAFFLKRNSWYFQHNVVKLIFRKDINDFLIIGEPYSLSTWLLTRLSKLLFPAKKIYFWSHGWYGKEGYLKKTLKKLFFKVADGIFLYGQYAKDLMVKEGFDAQKLHVIHNSLDYKQQLIIRDSILSQDLYQHHFRNNAYNLIFIGRLTKVKKIDLLIRALKKLNDKSPRYNFTIVGDGEEKEYLSKLAESYGLKENIWFYGACYDEKQNAELIYNADLCVSPGNVGLTAMHSMVYGTPVVTHDTYKWQMPEFEAIKRGKTGDFFKIDSVDSLVGVIESWFERNNENRETIRKYCFEEIDSNWTPEYQINVLKKIMLE